LKKLKIIILWPNTNAAGVFNKHGKFSLFTHSYVACLKQLQKMTDKNLQFQYIRRLPRTSVTGLPPIFSQILNLSSQSQERKSGRDVKISLTGRPKIRIFWQFYSCQSAHLLVKENLW
jgi:hypothetical protein